MEKTAPVSELNRSLSRILRAVAGGASFVATSDCVPVIVPEREAARQGLLDHLRSLPRMQAGPHDREEAYE